MHIGIEAQRMLRPDRHGMDIVALNLLRALLRRDPHNHYTVFLDRPDVNNELGDWPNLTRRVVRAPNYAAWEQIALPMALEKSPVDLLHLTSNTAPLWGSIPTVVTVHDVIFMADDPELRGSRSLYQRAGRHYRRWNVPRAARRAAGVVTVSRYERQRLLQALPIDTDRVHVVYNGVSETFLRQRSPDEVRAVRDRIGAAEPYLLFLGNHAPKKNTDRVLSAWLQLRRTHPVDLVVVDLSKKEISRRLRKLGDPSAIRSVICPGYVPQADLACLYAGAEAFLYPSLAESFGMPIIEAMACGTPVLTSSITAMPEIAGDAAMLVDPRSSVAIAAAAASLLTRPLLRRSLIAAGRRRAAQFTWAHAAEQVWSLHQQIGALPLKETGSC